MSQLRAPCRFRAHPGHSSCISCSHPIHTQVPLPNASPIRCTELLTAYTIDASATPDFFWVFVTRTFYYMGISIQVVETCVYLLHLYSPHLCYVCIHTYTSSWCSRREISATLAAQYRRGLAAPPPAPAPARTSIFINTGRASCCMGIAKRGVISPPTPRHRHGHQHRHRPSRDLPPSHTHAGTLFIGILLYKILRYKILLSTV